MSEDPERVLFPGRCCSDPNVEWVGNIGYGKAGSCRRPVYLFCTRCGVDRFVRCKANASSKCRSCAAIWRSYVQQVALQGLLAIGDGKALLLTVTGPGDAPHCIVHVRKGKRCPFGGQGAECAPCPCTDGPLDVAAFNASYTTRLNRVLEGIKRGEASAMVRGRRAKVPLGYFQGREVQDGKRRNDGAARLALHSHVILFRTDGKPLQLDKRLLKALLIRWGFGHSLRLDRIFHRPGSPKGQDWRRVAYYVAKYVSETADAKGDVPWPRGTMGEYLRPGFRSWSASRTWPQSMSGVIAEQWKRWSAGTEPQAPQALEAPARPLDVFMSSYTINWPLIIKYPTLRPLGRFLEHTPASPKVKRSGIRDPGPHDVEMF